MTLHTLWIVGILMLPSMASSQENFSGSYQEAPGWQIGVSMGPFLPSKVPGVEELLPFWGMSISTDLSVFRPEMTLLQAHAKGIDYYLGIFAFRNELDLYDFQFFWSWGITASYFTRLLITNVPSPFSVNGGLIGSVGFFWEISSRVRLRYENMMGLGPGRFVYVGVGLQLSFGSEENSDEP